MATRSVTQSQPPGGPNGGNAPTAPPPGVFLTEEEWSEVTSCASALFAALKCFEEYQDEAWELVVSIQQRFQRALSPIGERLSDQQHGE